MSNPTEYLEITGEYAINLYRDTRIYIKTATGDYYESHVFDPSPENPRIEWVPSGMKYYIKVMSDDN